MSDFHPRVSDPAATPMSPCDSLPRTQPERRVLQLRPNCECCNVDLPADSSAARICSFECTFCVACAENALGARCPNCGGELVARPRRPAEKLLTHPASGQRVFKAEGCRSLSTRPPS